MRALYTRLLMIGACLAVPFLLRAQSCSVSLGADTSLCAAAYTLAPAFSMSVHEDSLRIVYDATQGQSGLAGAAKVYMHSGAEMQPFGGWQHVIGNWGQDDGIGQMQALGQDRWAITIHPQSYYGYPVGSTLNGIFMVFRNADGSQTGKDSLGNDIWLDMAVYPPASAFSGVTASILTDALDSVLWSDGSTGLSLSVSQPGDYWVQAIDTAGCIARDTVHVGLGAIPVVDLGQPSICDGQAVTLDAGAGYVQYAWSTGDTTQSITVSNTGLYLVTVTNAAGCQGVDVVNVPAESAPVAGFSFAAGQGLNGIFSNTSTGAVSYAWDLDGDGQIDSQTSGTQTWVFPAAGSYTPSLIVGNACGSDTFSMSINVSAVGQEEVFEGEMRIVPNPSSGRVDIELEDKRGGRVQVYVHDAGGRMVYMTQPRASGTHFSEQLELSGLPDGIYLLRLVKEGRQMTERLLIRH